MSKLELINEKWNIELGENSDCSDCSDCSNCSDCSYCSYSRNLKNKKFMICNVQLTEEEYKKKMDDLK